MYTVPSQDVKKVLNFQFMEPLKTTYKNLPVIENVFTELKNIQACPKNSLKQHEVPVEVWNNYSIAKDTALATLAKMSAAQENPKVEEQKTINNFLEATKLNAAPLPTVPATMKTDSIKESPSIPQTPKTHLTRDFLISGLSMSAGGAGLAIIFAFVFPPFILAGVIISLVGIGFLIAALIRQLLVRTSL